MSYDTELLRRYAEERSETAFTEFVQRHVGLVHSSALRRLGGDTHAASDVVQQVFVSVARNSRKLIHCDHLSSWLFAATRNASLNHMRDEIRRKQREQKATEESIALIEDGADLNWEQVRPVLDETLDVLREADREAVLLRFFENKPFAEIGERLRLSENAARMRVERALGQLRDQLARRGIKSTAAGLAMAVSGYAATPVPAAVINAATTAALAAGSPAATGIGLALLNTKVVVSIVVASVTVTALVYITRDPPVAAPGRDPAFAQLVTAQPAPAFVAKVGATETMRAHKAEFDPKAARIAYERALKMEKMKEYEAAIALYSVAASHDPKLFDAFFARARIFQTLPLAKRDYSKAREDFTRCLEIDPNDFAARYNRALCSEYLRDYASAIADYTAIIDGKMSFSRWDAGEDQALTLAREARGRLTRFISSKPFHDSADVTSGREIITTKENEK